MNPKLAGFLAAFPFGILQAVPPFAAEGYLMETGKEPLKIELLAASHDSCRYREPGAPNSAKDLQTGGGIAVFTCEPAEHAKAMELYQARKYKEARVLFAAVKERYRPLEGPDDNYATLAGYYEMECLRKSGDLEGLTTALPGLPKGILTREFQQRQLELYVFWEAVRTKSWDRVSDLAKEHANVRLPGDQRAQVDYCQGLALEALNQPGQAIVAYNSALTADAGASEDISRQASLRILGIYKKDPDVQAALKRPDGGAKLNEAKAVAALYENSLGAGAPLPPEFKEFSGKRSSK